MDEHATDPTDPGTGVPDAAPRASAAASGGTAPSRESVEEFERLAVLRMGGGDVESAIDELPEAEAREVAEVAIDRVVRSYDNL